MPGLISGLSIYSVGLQYSMPGSHCFVYGQFSPSVVSDSLWPHGLQHARPPCPSPTPGAYSHSWPSSQWCHPTISSSLIPFSSSVFLSTRVFSSESALCIRWPKCWSVSISPFSEYSGLNSFRFDWFGLLRQVFVLGNKSTVNLAKKHSCDLCKMI